jgi:hypothetical protein
MLTTGQATSVDVVHTNLRAGYIPAEVLPSRQDEIRALQLYMSPDQGRTWNLIDQIAPSKGRFAYDTHEDGEFWFQVVVINQQGQADPPNHEKAPVIKMKLIVDTQPPILKIVSAQRQGSELVVSWEVHEKYPDPQSLKLEYRTADSAAWLPMSFATNAVGTARAQLVSAAPLVVRLQCKDLAGNTNEATAQVAAGVAPIAYNSPANNVMAKAPQPALTPAEAVKPPPAVDHKQPPLALPGNDPAIAPPPAGQQQVAPPYGTAAAGQIVATSKDNSQGSPVPAPVAPLAGNRQLPPLQLINDREIMLEYEVSKVGPSGLGSVEVWITRDGGMKWDKFATDPDAPGFTTGGKYQRTLELPGDGVYGITLVVRNTVGLGKPPPRSGDAPDMLIEVDTIPPEAALRKPMPDPAKRDSMLLTWTATDRNLGANPITLEWAEQQQGPWYTIRADLPNTGRYSWQLPAKMPSHVFLKLTVRDNAGNVAVALTEQAQLIDVSEPEVHLIRVAPVSRKN